MGRALAVGPADRAADARTILLRVHILPALGDRQLQQIEATEIDGFYVELKDRVAPGTAHYIHIVLGSCLAAAERKDKIARNPMDKVDRHRRRPRAITAWC
jgi:hypothetical protein